MRELLLGCGSRRDKIISTEAGDDFSDYVDTLDYNDEHHPDIVHDLNVFPWPILDDTYDEVHAYEVLEHLGQQGDYKLFFQQFTEIHRILKPGGVFCATVPWFDSPWALGDPSHTRVFHPYWVDFLNQNIYESVGENPISDFRGIYKVSFEKLFADRIETEDGKASFFAFVLRATVTSGGN